MNKLILSALLGALSSTSVLADDLAIKIEHEATALGPDGVTRSTRFGERLIRRDNQSWLARILPAGAHEEAAHAAGGKEHQHMDFSSASRWVLRGDDGKLRLRMVNAHDKIVVNVPAVEYANIGFDGKWSTASQLLDPEQIKRMKAIARSAPAGTRWYEGGTRDVKVQVLWDEKEKYPRRIESANAAGTSRSSMVATREAMPAVMPWSALNGYEQKEYSDLLD